ncbi:uncharacterized protein LOC131604897 [Vicia villosa]|uniref:uncharacterized protein LOC131604897 n=1 Tax=Vicia villosa TaxID=3911 RepID=UPI00273ABA29|nr:uncharacterized protein LOC131604897 [Vicia villosa]
MVNRDQNADEVTHRVRQDNMVAENNLTTMIERIMAQNGMNTGLRSPNYTSPLADSILQTELPRGCKIPKFTKFSGDTSESTVKHIAMYLTEAGDLANRENLRIKYFPSSLTKNEFTWFTTLPPNSIDTWPYLERLFHEQFYMGRTKISLKELAEKARANKSYKKERVAYVEAEDEEFETFNDSYSFEEVEVDLAELKEAPPYSCKMLTPSNGKNPVEVEKNDKFPKKHAPSMDLIQNAIKDGRLKFADKAKSHMKVDVDPFHVADTNYTEPVEINMVDMVEVGENEAKKLEVVSTGKQATKSLPNNIAFNTDVEGFSAEKFEPKTIEGLVGKMNEATEGLRMKFEKVRISKIPALGVNMVDLNLPAPEMGEL